MLPRPPPRPSFADYYGRYLPELWHALTGGESFAAPPIAIGVRLHPSAAPQNLVLTLAGSSLVASESDGPVVAWFTFDEEAFRVGATQLLPRLLRRLDPLVPTLPGKLRAALTSARVGPFVERLRALPGRVTIIYEDDAGDRSRTEVQLGSAGPAATVEAKDAEVSDLIAGLRLANVIRSRTRLGGDTGYLLRLVACLDPG